MSDEDIIRTASQPVSPDGTFLAQANPVALINDFEHYLKSEIWDDKDMKWVKTEDKPFLNNEGVGKVINIIRVVVNTNAILSRLDKKEIGDMTISIGDNIVCLLISKYKEYALDPLLIETVINMCCQVCNLALKRAQDQGERIFWKTNVRSHELFQYRDQPIERNRDSGNVLNLFKNGR